MYIYLENRHNIHNTDNTIYIIQKKYIINTSAVKKCENVNVLMNPEV